MSKRRTKVNRKPIILVMDTGWSQGANAVRVAGGEPLTVSPRDVDKLEATLDAGNFDGLLLMGGGDVDPRLYGEKPHKQVYGVSETRDYTEWTALDFAKTAGLPVLGICRGSQLMAVHNGGTLRQHITGHRGNSHVAYAESDRFKAIIGRDRATFVSLHHQVVRRHGSGFRVAARSYDGHIEAVESKDGRCLGVQFHPEMDYWRNPESLRLFCWLTVTAAARSNLVKPKLAKTKPQRSKTKTKPKPQRQLPARPTPTYSFEDGELGALARETLKADVRRAKAKRPISSRWFCRDCGLEFDKQQDRDDHEYWICGEPTIRTTEPPPGHADWMPGATT